MLHKLGLLVLPAVMAVSLVGCGGSGRQAIEGTVTLDGQPLEQGYIRLNPKSGTSSPVAGAQIENGSYSIAPERGVFAGSFLVEITSMRLSGRKLADPETGKAYAEKVQVLPARYNKASELNIEVVEGEKNHFDFELASK